MRYLSILIALMAIVGGSVGADLKNTVTVEAADSLGTVVAASDDAVVTVNETFTADFFKDADVLEAKPGETITYRYRFINTGTGKLTGLSVTDGMLGSVAMSLTTLAPGESAVGEKIYVVKDSDVDLGVIQNEAIAKTDKLEINATAYVTIVPGVPAITIEKLTDVDTTDIGSEIEYKFNVTNTGEVALTITSVIDDKLGEIAMPKTKLDPGESVVAVKKHIVTVEDIE